MKETTKISKQTQGQGWDIFEALREPRTEREKSPPDDSSYDQACVSLSVAVSDPLFGVIRHIESEYGFSNKSQAAQRLQRVGLQEIESPTDGELGEINLRKLGAYRDVVFRYVPSVGKTKFGFGSLREEQELPVDYGWDTKNRDESFSIFWNQKDQIRRYKDQLRVSDSDIFQWGIVNATVELGEAGLVDEIEAGRAKETQEKIWERVADRIQFTRDAALMTISRAYDAESHDRMADYCKRTVPDLWQEFKRSTYSNHQTLSDNEFLYGVGL